MVLSATLVLWFIMLAMAVNLTPIKPWTKLAVWAALALLSVVLVLLHALVFVWK